MNLALKRYGAFACLAELIQDSGGLKFTSPLKAITKPVSHFIQDEVVGAVQLSANSELAVLAGLSEAAVERRLVPEAIRLFAEGRLTIDGRRVRIKR